MHYKILICNSNIVTMNELVLFLERKGYILLKVFNGTDALDVIRRNKDLHLVLIDSKLSLINGFNLLKKIRKLHTFPIIMTSENDNLNDRILGLELGADDFIYSPYNPLDVIARTKTLLRRSYVYSDKHNEKAVIKIGPIELDNYYVRVKVNEKEIHLTSMEYKLLKILMENAGRILTKTQLYQLVWNSEYINGDNTITVHLSRLREKLESDPKNPIYLKTVRGIGYKFDNSIKHY